jgi:DNA (cytosine-5)-methyltransferase 1
VDELPHRPVVDLQTALGQLHHKAPQGGVATHICLTRAKARRWIWWKPRYPRGRIGSLEYLLETAPKDLSWHSPDETERLLDMMSDDAREDVRRARCYGAPVIGCAYVRTPGRRKAARSTSVLKVRLDGLAGCLWMPGGSSRQIILQLDGERIRSRLLSCPRSVSSRRSPVD